jgi:hypothetical protein
MSNEVLLKYLQADVDSFFRAKGQISDMKKYVEEKIAKC